MTDFTQFIPTKMNCQTNILFRQTIVSCCYNKRCNKNETRTYWNNIYFYFINSVSEIVLEKGIMPRTTKYKHTSN